MVFADTSGIVAAFHASDDHHAEAAAAWRSLAQSREAILTTDLVLAETVTLLRRRGGWAVSRSAGDALLRSRAVEIVRASREQMDAAWREFLRDADPKLSLCDALSFIVMRERGVTRALTFDRHFADAGFGLLPARPAR
ncbi:MAG: PIN domain-containing protein [Myxococcota bacterium]